MTCPRCGAQIDNFPCFQCGFPETMIRVGLRKRRVVRRSLLRIVK